MPIAPAVVVSSILFSMCHFRLQVLSWIPLCYRPQCLLAFRVISYVTIPSNSPPSSPPISQTFLPLLLLGIVFSSIFLATRNLLPPMILHSAWNIFVLYNLLFRPA